eukprot:3851252-Prymnesium_polylepis.3
MQSRSDPSLASSSAGSGTGTASWALPHQPVRPPEYRRGGPPTVSPAVNAALAAMADRRCAEWLETWLAERPRAEPQAGHQSSPTSVGVLALRLACAGA